MRRKGSRNDQFYKRIPADVKRVLDRLPPEYRPTGWGKEFITISTGESDKRKAAAEYIRIAHDVQERFTALRAGVRRLSHKEAVALAGGVYRAMAAGAEDDPGSAELWRRALHWNEDARSGEFGIGALMIGEEEARRASMHQRFGGMADALLAHKCLIVDAESRAKLIEAIAGALDDAARKLERNAEGDYRPDPVAARFPESSPTVQARKPNGKKLTLADLFEQWLNHPEQAEQAPSTVRRYRGVLDAAARFLGNPDAREVREDDLQRYSEARMSDPEKPLKPRVVRDVHKAALSSVFDWARRKKIVASNPALAIDIKLPKRTKLKRPKEASHEEARTIADAAMSVPVAEARPGSVEAAVRWCPLLCLYTGSRISEMIQLRKEDICVVDGENAVRITPAAGAVKDGEIRHAPLHPRLIALGFLDFVRSAKSGPLFYDPTTRRKKDATTPQYELVAADVASWSRDNGLGDPLLLRPLHSLRHRFITLARRADIAEQYVEEIAGHSPGRMNRAYGSYPVEVLAREVRKLDPELVEGRRWSSDTNAAPPSVMTTNKRDGSS